MSEYILNLLPTTQDEQAEFSSIVPHDTMIFARRSTLTDEHRENATIVMGHDGTELRLLVLCGRE